MRTITKDLKCILLRNGVELWVETNRIAQLVELIRNTQGSRFIEYEGQVINTADVTGIFTPETMDAYTRRKNKQWQCSFGNWHDWREKCDCKRSQTEIDAENEQLLNDIRKNS